MRRVVTTTRRIFTDGRSFPSNEEPTFAGYSIGQWLDTDNDGKFDTLVVETAQPERPAPVRQLRRPAAR